MIRCGDNRSMGYAMERIFGRYLLHICYHAACLCSGQSSPPTLLRSLGCPTRKIENGRRRISPREKVAEKARRVEFRRPPGGMQVQGMRHGDHHDDLSSTASLGVVVLHALLLREDVIQIDAEESTAPSWNE